MFVGPGRPVVQNESRVDPTVKAALAECADGLIPDAAVEQALALEPDAGQFGMALPLVYLIYGAPHSRVDTHGVTDPALSPIKSGDEPTWTLMADFVYYGASPSQQLGWQKELNAHRQPNSIPAGANDLFNDLHVSWIKWNGGSNMRTNTMWAPGNLYIWRRSMEIP